MSDLEELRKRFYSNDDDDFLFDAPTSKQPATSRPQEQRRSTTSRANAHASSSTVLNDSEINRNASERMDVDTVASDFSLIDVSEETDLQQLMRHWQNERHAPDILQSQDALLSRILDQIRRQVGP